MFANANANTGSRKRTRDDSDGLTTQDSHLDKRTRHSTGRAGDNEKWYHGHHDSVLSTPILTREQIKYDSDDDEASSLVSEPGSPQDVSMSSGDEMDATLSESPEDDAIQPRANPWGHRLQTNRIATPIVSMRPSARSIQRNSFRQHIRQRHPQEYSSEHLEVPSPIDEDEVPTPPSAAEAAGSQLSMLSVSDIDMIEDNDLVPTISVDPARPSSRNVMRDTHHMLETLPEFEPLHSGPAEVVVRKQRQRSGALSSGNSPVRADSNNPAENKLRGFSVGYRADCEKCRMRVPGHMNHFL